MKGFHLFCINYVIYEYVSSKREIRKERHLFLSIEKWIEKWIEKQINAFEYFKNVFWSE